LHKLFRLIAKVLNCDYVFGKVKVLKVTVQNVVKVNRNRTLTLPTQPLAEKTSKPLANYMFL